MIYYWTDMVCGGETAHHSGTVNWTPGKITDCEPGKYYLWYETYGCGFGECPTTKIGWYCAKCERVSSETKCAPAPKKMSGEGCHSGGIGAAEIMLDTNP